MKIPKKLSKIQVKAAIDRNEKRIEEGRKPLFFYVKAKQPEWIKNEWVEKIIISAKGKVVETLPYEHKTKQFHVRIDTRYAEALYESLEIIDISDKKFKPPGSKPQLRLVM